ncbi:MAG TPA: LamG-like jellyroll fold domain-containing protein, partial [Solirubrobacterales bacterium]|nr:LamG-like jellyroll fold domain-containing protein [Solirubrobacterales bacterium]
GAGRIAEHYASNGTNKRPQAVLSASPNPAAANEEVTLDGSESSDPDGTIVKYQWDLDGNGSFETDTGATPTAASEYPEEGEIEVGLRVLDDDFATDVATETLVIGEEPPPGPTYSEVVEETPGLLHYWRFEEGSGTTLADSAGEAAASTSGGVSLGAGGAPGTDLAAAFDGGNDFAQAAIDLSGTAQTTVEFWLKWNSYSDEDNLAMELTPNFNANEGGFLVDPNASQGSFGIGIGSGESRNNAFFTRPSAGKWHHYAFVLDSEAAASEQIVPYVDGKAVSYSKGASGTGAGKFAKSTLYFMSRAGEALFGAGTLDELAIYDDSLTSVQIAAHFEAAAE